MGMRRGFVMLAGGAAATMLARRYLRSRQERQAMEGEGRPEGGTIFGTSSGYEQTGRTGATTGVGSTTAGTAGGMGGPGSTAGGPATAP